jgi:excisionase family DNA binding protein
MTAVDRKPITADQVSPGQFYSIDDAATLLRCSRSTIYSLTQGDPPQIEMVKIGRLTRVTGESLKKVLSGQGLKRLVSQRHRARKTQRQRPGA